MFEFVKRISNIFSIFFAVVNWEIPVEKTLTLLWIQG